MDKKEERIPNVHVLIDKIQKFVEKAPDGDDKDIVLRCLRVMTLMFTEKLPTKRPCINVYPEIPDV
jgi:hypothetical protein